MLTTKMDIGSLSAIGQFVATQSDRSNNHASSKRTRFGSQTIYTGSSLGVPVVGLAGSIGTYLFPHQVNVQALQRPIFSTILITSDKQPNYCATGVVVKFNGTKYLATSYHVIADKFRGDIPDLYGLSTRNGSRDVIPIENELLLCFVKSPHADAAVLKYDGGIEGVDLAESVDPNMLHTSFAIGFPSCFREHYTGRSITPFLSFGLSSIEDKNETLKIDGDMLPTPRQCKSVKAEIQLPWVLYSGAISDGNSGGGLFTTNGKLIAICFGFTRFSTQKYQQNEGNRGATIKPAIFFSIRELLEKL